MIILLMGVSGSGKTTVGQLLARELGWLFIEGDGFHPPANIAKMKQGTPLTDADREAWLATLRRQIRQLILRQQSAVITCSALKQSYRQLLRSDQAEVQLVYLKGPYELIQSRLQARQGHFMNPSLLSSQFTTLEEPEKAVTVDIKLQPEAIVKQIRQKLGL